MRVSGGMSTKQHTENRNKRYIALGTLKMKRRKEHENMTNSLV